MGQRPVDLASGGGHVGVAQLLRLHEAALSLSSETLQANQQLHYLQADYAHMKSYFRFVQFAKFQNFKICKIPKFQNLQNSNISKFAKFQNLQNSKICKIPKFHNSKICKNSKIP